MKTNPIERLVAVYTVKDMVLGNMLGLTEPCKVVVCVDEESVTLHVAGRDIEWSRRSRKPIGSGFFFPSRLAPKKKGKR